MKKFILLLIISTMLPGCSMMLLRDLPDYVHTEDVYPGVKKSVALGTFGAPAHNYVNDKGESCDLFKFRQGYSAAAKHSRLVFHGAADILTLGLWEAVGTPLEVAFDGENLTYEVCYNKENIVTSVTPLSEDGKLIPQPTTSTPDEKQTSKETPQPE